MITRNEIERFAECSAKALTTQRHQSGIGTLGERLLHLILKNFFEPDTDCQEQKVGRFVADIKNADGITEIQTRAFGSMRKKLTAFTKEHHVNVVFPIATQKCIIKINPDSGELSERRKSPKHGKPWDILYELYALRPIMPLDNVTFTLVFCEMDEFRVTGIKSLGRRRNAVRYERIPTSLVDILVLETPEDMEVLIPPNLGDSFSSAEFAKAAKMTPRTSGYAIRTLVSLGVIEHTETKGKAYIYKKVDVRRLKKDRA